MDGTVIGVGPRVITDQPCFLFTSKITRTVALEKDGTRKLDNSAVNDLRHFQFAALNTDINGVVVFAVVVFVIVVTAVPVVIVTVVVVLL